MNEINMGSAKDETTVCWYVELPSARWEESRCSSSALPYFLCPCFSQFPQLDQSVAPPCTQSYPMPKPIHTMMGKAPPAETLPCPSLLLPTRFTRNLSPQIQTLELRRGDLDSTLYHCITFLVVLSGPLPTTSLLSQTEMP